MNKRIEGFSKLTKSEKIDWITQTHFKNSSDAKSKLLSYWNSDSELQQTHDEFIENTLTNFYMPLGVAPNFRINGEAFTLPMVIEESSVIAAASNAAKFWQNRGGFHAKVIDTLKVGQIHFLFEGDSKILSSFVNSNKPKLLEAAAEFLKNMEARGGGIQSIELIDKSDLMPHYFQLHLKFKTADAMGANFINSCLESIAEELKNLSKNEIEISGNIEIVMSILSNYVPECLVHASVQCPVSELSPQKDYSGEAFAKKMVLASEIAKHEPFRAVTHNKGIMNGVDAVVIASGNDFRAVEAGVHAFASRNGKYTSLSNAYIKNEVFHMELTLPLALGTVGGLTNLHPLVQWSMELLGNPNAKKLMEIIAVAGLAQNFAALKSLVTSGIQKGHMKMHLLNILNQMGASKTEKNEALIYFKTHKVSVKAVGEFLQKSKT
jgi:hydroxymethylglutaryl-CoA reductase